VQETDNVRMVDAIGKAALTVAVIAVIGGLSLLPYAYLRRD
jgi:hypothetical protein